MLPLQHSHPRREMLEEERCQERRGNMLSSVLGEMRPRRWRGRESHDTNARHHRRLIGVGDNAPPWVR